MPRTPVITLLTDFGWEDSYTAEIKGVLLQSVDARIVDVCHSIPAFDIRWAAFQLYRAYSHFPKGTIHMAVVDPGVGTERKAIYVKTKRFRFLGPDNGILSWAVHHCEKVEGVPAKIYEIPIPDGLAPTFHGRDVFAPAAVQGIKSTSGFVPIRGLLGEAFPDSRELDGVRRGEIIGSDHFGNVVTSISADEEGKVEGHVEGRSEIYGCAKNYQAIPKDKVALIRGSHGFWELSCRENSAWERLQISRGDEVTVYPADE